MRPLGEQLVTPTALRPVSGADRAGREERPAGARESQLGSCASRAPSSGASCWNSRRTTSDLAQPSLLRPRLPAAGSGIPGARQQDSVRGLHRVVSVRCAAASRNWACFVRKATAASARWFARACATEWEFRRILCPNCAEENHAQAAALFGRGLPARSRRGLRHLQALSEERGSYAQRLAGSGGRRDRRRAPGPVGCRARLPEDRTQPDGAVNLAELSQQMPHLH